jgi:2-octaprenyl-6-methoxyphenol hydroxylase
MRGKRPRGPEALVDAAKGAVAHLRETASRLG